MVNPTTVNYTKVFSPEIIGLRFKGKYLKFTTNFTTKNLQSNITMNVIGATSTIKQINNLITFF